MTICGIWSLFAPSPCVPCARLIVAGVCCYSRPAIIRRAAAPKCTGQGGRPGRAASSHLAQLQPLGALESGARAWRSSNRAAASHLAQLQPLGALESGAGAWRSSSRAASSHLAQLQPLGAVESGARLAVEQPRARRSYSRSGNRGPLLSRSQIRTKPRKYSLLATSSTLFHSAGLQTTERGGGFRGRVRSGPKACQSSEKLDSLAIFAIADFTRSASEKNSHKVCTIGSVL